MNYLKNILTLQRIGLDYKLILFFELPLVLIFIIDYFRADFLGLNIFTFTSFFESIVIFLTNFTLLDTLLFLGIFLIIPIVYGLLINFTLHYKRRINSSTSNRRKLLFLFAHLLFSFLTIYYHSLSKQTEKLSGFRIEDFETSYLFRPLINLAGPTTITISTIAIAIIGIVVNYLAAGSVNNIVKDFKIWFNLADTARDYFPVQPDNIIYADNASMAPSINEIVKKSNKFLTIYQQKVPTSHEAKEYLTESANACRALLKDYLFTDNTRDDFEIEFLPGTSRGFEVGLMKIVNLKKIIVSPFEHSSQKDVISWFVKDREIEVIELEFNNWDFLKLTWTLQLERLKTELRNNTTDIATKKTAVLLSEVYYKNGQLIKVKEVLEFLLTDINPNNFVFIIDGSQAAANLTEPFRNFSHLITNESFYYFSCHKWLLSPNTCGVLISQYSSTDYVVPPYDLFGRNLPTSTIDPSVIFGLKASLELLFEEAMFHHFKDLSLRLKNSFIEKINPTFSIIQSESEELRVSSFIAIKPNNRHRWIHSTSTEIWNIIKREGMDFTFIELDNGEWWFRISFPYFLQLRHINNLTKKLNKTIAPI